MKKSKETKSAHKIPYACPKCGFDYVTLKNYKVCLICGYKIKAVK